MFLDHVTVAVPNLAEPLARLSGVGVQTQYGGVHSNGITHMALASFRDGSYLEVVAPVSEEGRVSLWSDYALPARGGTAWTIASDDLTAELARADASGIEGKGPVVIRRNKPGGEVGCWELGYFGSAQPGGTLPFLIHDITHRDVRVPSEAQARSPFAGWSAIVLAVHDQQAAAHEVQKLYGWDAPVIADGFSHFSGTPVYLHSPAEHLAEFGESPWAGVLALAPDSAADDLCYAGASQLMDKSVRWLDLSWKQFRIGVEAP